ncbi:dihydroxyacetone kinase subunit DhaL [Clostridium gasigenes]|uniref:phosphoenolpyruvate--glycerone phosphotransferase n=1 Tax=Clostridium gasigenes TaxID=94869 RepID=A0A1H0VP98_9CLOT|nr:dihydroxyacetone kinase subunit DhaL [Clostridium gasigenes]MBB6624914.1 dihydroxyacetone kinase subunit L [Clostridium gasigenes]SDP80174.1 dihydroxyacetone kinase DhaL subunit [Clostridium gasigenes]
MINGIKVKEILNKIDFVLAENKLFLSELDAAIGDGDHGLNMNKGFNAVVEKIKTLPDEDISNIIKASGMALVSNVGGAAGPLYGTAFMKASMAIAKKTEIDINDFINMLEAALEGIKMRGKGVFGEKTMIDSLEPAFIEGRKALEKNSEAKEVLNIIKNSAENGMNETKKIIATKGRASYLGERSIGHQDAGSTSMYLILKTIAEEI